MRQPRVRAPQQEPVVAPPPAPRRSRRDGALAAATLSGLGLLAVSCALLTLAAASAPNSPLGRALDGPLAPPTASPSPNHGAATPSDDPLARQAGLQALARRDIRLKFAYEDQLVAMRGEIQARARQNAQLQSALTALEQHAARLDARVSALASVAARLDPAAKAGEAAQHISRADEPAQHTSKAGEAAQHTSKAGEPDQHTSRAGEPASGAAPGASARRELLGLRGADSGRDDASDAARRLAANGAALRRIDAAAVAAAGQILAPVAAENARVAAALGDVGLNAERLSPAGTAAAMGGPFEAWNSPALPGATPFETAFGALNAALARRAYLHAALRHAPLRAPLLGPHEVSSGYGYRIDPFFGRPALHSGMDFIGALGESVRAVASGSVSLAGESGGYGEMVEIDHGGGLVTRYGHLSQIFVVEGQKIAAGAIIGALGSTGRSTGPHLHYEIRDEGAAVDPAPYLKAGRLIDPTS